MVPNRVVFGEMVCQVLISFPPKYVGTILSYSVLHPIKSHVYYSLNIFCLDVTFIIIFDAVFYVATDVGSCGWLIYSGLVYIDVDFGHFSKNPLNYASVDDVMTVLMTLYSICTGPFLG